MKTTLTAMMAILAIALTFTATMATAQTSVSEVTKETVIKPLIPEFALSDGQTVRVCIGTNDELDMAMAKNGYTIGLPSYQTNTFSKTMAAFNASDDTRFINHCIGIWSKEMLEHEKNHPRQKVEDISECSELGFLEIALDLVHPQWREAHEMIARKYPHLIAPVFEITGGYSGDGLPISTYCLLDGKQTPDGVLVQAFESGNKKLHNAAIKGWCAKNKPNEKLTWSEKKDIAVPALMELANKFKGKKHSSPTEEESDESKTLHFKEVKLEDATVVKDETDGEGNVDKVWRFPANKDGTVPTLRFQGPAKNAPKE